jgi:hypothetical protein
VPLPLATLIHGELAEQGNRQRVGMIALLRFGQERALDLGGAQRHVADDAVRRDLGNDVHARGATGLIGPGTAAKPGVEGFASAIERTAIIILGQRTRRR